VSGSNPVNDPVEYVLRRDRGVVLVALCLIIAASWVYVLAGAGMSMSAFQMSSWSMALGPSSAGISTSTEMGPGANMGLAMQAMATPVPWTFGYAVLMFFMWWVMMIAMMLPSAAPMVLLYGAVSRKAAKTEAPASQYGSSGAFTGGYLIAWAGFSIVAVLLQWLLERAGLLSPMMLNTTSAVLAGSILVFAGLYQLTPLKEACLRHCRSPIQFLSHNWKNGATGALKMGLHHGVYCLGCCWGLMAILFFGGIMNLYWIIGLATLVFIEKLAPAGFQVSRALAVVLVAWGSWYLYAAIVN